MTPEEKFNQDVWWILQEIKKDDYLTPKGQRIEFLLRILPNTKSIRRKDVDYGFPQKEVQKKLLFKLQEWEALEAEPVDDLFRNSYIFDPTIYRLTIKQPKFDELYRRFEGGVDNENNEQKKPLAKTATKTSTDYILEALIFFKNEYNKVKMWGLRYEYPLGENIKSEQTDQDYDDYSARQKAIERLTEAGFITEYKIEERIENDGYYIWDYAICKIDETKITQPEAPRISEQKVQDLIHKIAITEMPPLVIQKTKTPNNTAPKPILTKGLKAEITVGKLISYSDGTLGYDARPLEMRNQLKDLCRLFMSRHNALTTIDQIRDEIIPANKRKFTSFKTISKYVSELHTILQNYYKQPVIINQKEEGWYFRPPK